MKQGAFIVLNRKNKSEFFLIKRSDFPVWENPGGGIEKGETPENAAIRESFEETGFKVRINKKIAEYVSHKNNKVFIHLFEGEVISGKFIPEYKGCLGQWFKYNNLPISMTAATMRFIKDCRQDSQTLITRQHISLFSYLNIHLAFLHPVKFFSYFFKKLG